MSTSTSSELGTLSTPPSSVPVTATPSFENLQDVLLRHMMEKHDLENIRDDMVSVARKAGQMMIDADPSVDASCEKKNSSDRVTATDKAIESMVQTTLTRLHPSIEFLGEETFKEGQQLTDEPTFVCDPIDGTLNFIHGFPNVAISLALTMCKTPVVAVVYNPFRGDLFTAIKNRGAFLTRSTPGGKSSIISLPVKPTAEPIGGLGGCLVAVEWGSERAGANWALRTRVASRLLSSAAEGGAMAHSVRSSGSAALDMCYVAAGWIDVFWEGGCWIWDVCAGWLLVLEAGGIVAGANPGEWSPTLEGRSYLAVRGAASGQQEAVSELWGLMDGKRFEFGVKRSA
jgi:myo-inositol-1(or 4)-monophosphatase